jgi:hypothetical protein
MFYNEHLHHFESGKYIYCLWQAAFPTGIPKIKDKFGTVFNRVEIFKCYIVRDYERDSVNTYIKTIEIDNINPDNFINGSAM